MFLTRIAYGIAYFIILIYEIIKATIDVAKRCINKNIEPVVVEIETVLERPVSQTILANSITLTPGTLSIELDSDKKVLKVAKISPSPFEGVILFEKYIKKIMEP